MTTSASGRRTRADRAREALGAACVALFGERGYTGTRVADIAERAGVSAGTFYAHFTSKWAAYEQTMPEPAAAELESAEPPTAPTRRGQRTRAQLVGAARAVFQENGYFATRIVDITTAAGVASGSFYTYFDSKEEIFREVMGHVVEDLYGGSHPNSRQETADPVERIRMANRRYLESYVRSARMFMLLDEAASIDPEFARLRRDVRRTFVARAAHSIRLLQAEGLADPALDADTAASALTAMVGHSAHVWIGLGEPYDPEVAVETLTRLWVQGIGMRMP